MQQLEGNTLDLDIKLGKPSEDVPDMCVSQAVEAEEGLIVE
jgi:hypothetical protein